MTDKVSADAPAPDEIDAAMAAGLLDTVRKVARSIFGETCSYPCDDVKRMGSEIAQLRAALEEVRTLVFCANYSETRYPKARAALTQEPRT